MVTFRSLGRTFIPERRYRRRAVKPLARLLLRWFTSHRSRGIENFPRTGPFIAAGNHRGIMEVFLMVALCPRPMEVLGAGDIPLDPRYRFLADLYGYIPYRRGEMDRKALSTAARALKDGRVVGIFPEGGIWKAGEKSAHRGVAWLSVTTGAPVVPIGFAGVYRAVGRAIRLEKPRLETTVGRPIPPPPRPRGTTRRDHITAHAHKILEEITALIPEWDRQEHRDPPEEEFSLLVRAGARDVTGEILHPELLSEFFHTPVLIDVLYTNLKRQGVAPLRRFGRPYPADKLARAVAILLGYTIRTNPAFFPYRLGDGKARLLTDALFSLYRLADALSRAAGSRGETIRIIPIHRYRTEGSGDWVERREPPQITRF
ncbi:MAG: lysophospholipid acyltransferase family protein [Alkalispirochaetaceae bacterium]